jgi:hypothetical protein
MGSLLCFLAVACGLSVLALTSRSAALWPRMPLAALLTVVYLFSAAGLSGLLTAAVLLAGLGFAFALWRWGDCRSAALKLASGPLTVAILVSVYVAFRPSLLEYPVDHINYWQRLMEAAGAGSANASACRLEGLATYIPYCTLWFKLAAAWPVSGPWYVSGTFARLVHLGELLLLTLTLVRLWMVQLVKPLAAAVMVVLVVAGTGYLYDVFVINHALQGSVLAAALLVECASVLCWLLSRLRLSISSKGGAPLVLAWFGLAGLYLLLEIKLHGLFALLILVWLLVVPVNLVVLASFSSSACWLRRSSRWLLGSVALALTAGLFVAKDAIRIPIAPNFAGVAIRWGDRLGFEWLSNWGPVSFVPRTSDTRPEALAVLSLIAAIVLIISSLRSSRPMRGPSADYAISSSVYVLSILVAYALPPFSNLFLKLNPDYSSHMRMMWGACLISPLPCLLFAPARRYSHIVLMGSLAALAVVLLPIQFSSGQRKQLFFSKSRHLAVPTPAWADPGQVANVLVPELDRIAGSASQRQRVHVVADPIVRSALYPFGFSAEPPLGLGADRFFQVSALPPDVLNPSPVLSGIEPARFPLGLPDLVIQQDQRECFYSVYAEMQAYDACVAAVASGFQVNRWSPDLLRQSGYALKWESPDGDYRIWQRVSA